MQLKFGEREGEGMEVIGHVVRASNLLLKFLIRPKLNRLYAILLLAAQWWGTFLPQTKATTTSPNNKRLAIEEVRADECVNIYVIKKKKKLTLIISFELY